MKQQRSSAQPSSPHERVTRREFLAFTGIGAMLVAIGGMLKVVIDFLRPNVLFEPPTRFDAGSPEQYAVGSVTLSAKEKTYIIRTQEGFKALSAICTHLGCVTRWDQDRSLIACPCHGSKFAQDGTVLHGPAPKPLPHVEIRLSERGRLLVDKAVSVNPNFILRF